jgi:hypothetical protein
LRHNLGRRLEENHSFDLKEQFGEFESHIKDQLTVLFFRKDEYLAISGREGR